MKCLVISGDGAAYLIKNPHDNWKEFKKAADEKWGENDLYIKEHPDLASAEADIDNLGWDIDEEELVQDGSKLTPLEFGYLFSLDDEDMTHLTESKKTFKDLVEAIAGEDLKSYLSQLKNELTRKGYEVGFGDCTSDEDCGIDAIPDNPSKDDYLMTFTKYGGDHDPVSYWIMGDLGVTNVVYRAYPTNVLFRLSGNLSSDISKIIGL